MSNKYSNGTEVQILHSDGKWYDGYIVDCAGMNKIYGWQYRCRIPELDTFSMKCHDGGKLVLKPVRHTGKAPNMQQIPKGFQHIVPSLDLSKAFGLDALYDIRKTLTATAIQQASEKMDQDFLNQQWDRGNVTLRRFVEFRINEALLEVRKERDLLRLKRDELQQRNNSQAQQLGNKSNELGTANTQVQFLSRELADRDRQIAKMFIDQDALHKQGWAVIAASHGCNWKLVADGFHTAKEAEAQAHKLATINQLSTYYVAAVGKGFRSVAKQTVTHEVQSV